MSRPGCSAKRCKLHLDLRARKLREQGAAANDNAQAALRRFGNRTHYQDLISQQWGWSMWERIVQDFRLGICTLLRAPGFASITISTLATGLGINTATYSMVNGVMLKDLPHREPGRLVSLWEESPPQETDFSSSGSGLSNRANSGSMLRTTVSIANIRDYQTNGAFDGMASYAPTAMNLTGNGSPERLNGEAVSANFFSVLGIAPLRGRGFLAQENTPEADPTVIATFDFRQNRLGGDSQATERAVLLDGKSRPIVGVLPRGFESPMQLSWKDRIEFYVPATYSKEQLFNRGDHDVNVVARLKPVVSIEAASAGLKVIQSHLAQHFPRTNRIIFWR